MMKYCIHGNFVDKDTFYIELRNHYDAAPQRITYDKYLEELATYGEVCLNTSKTGYKFKYFSTADEEVYELADIIADAEYDPLDGDAFVIAFAVYKKGFRKQGSN